MSSDQLEAGGRQMVELSSLPGGLIMAGLAIGGKTHCRMIGLASGLKIGIMTVETECGCSGINILMAGGAIYPGMSSSHREGADMPERSVPPAR